MKNRFRFLEEILESLQAVLPTGRVGVHLSPNGIFNDMGSPDFRETFLYAAGRLNRFGLAYLHVLDGLAFGFHELGRPFISNPDLAERLANGWPLNPTADMKVWYSFDEVGYTDFPRHETGK